MTRNRPEAEVEMGTDVFAKVIGEKDDEDYQKYIALGNNFLVDSPVMSEE